MSEETQGLATSVTTLILEFLQASLHNLGFLSHLAPSHLTKDSVTPYKQILLGKYQFNLKGIIIFGNTSDFYNLDDNQVTLLS